MKPHPKIIDRILEGIRESRTFCVVGHIRPDGDCVGSQLGLALALRNEGKKVVCWNEDPIPQLLFTAVSTDTGSFQYPTTRPGTYHVAGELVRLGADIAKICEEVYQSYPLSRARLLRHIYRHFRLTHDDQIAYFWLKKADYARSGADSSDSEGLIDHIRAIASVVVACVFEEIEPELTRISLRSKSEKVNVNEIAALFGGGGHPAAAGGRIPGKPLSVQRKVIAAVKKALNSNH